MLEPRVCLSMVDADLPALRENEALADLIEARLDLIGPGWPELVKGLRKPWIACNRRPEEGGMGESDEVKREEQLLRAVEAGAEIVDIEYRTGNLSEFLPRLKERSKCLISHHDLVGTPSLKVLSAIVEKQILAGAQICKVVTKAENMEDNLRLLQLLREFPGVNLIAFGMGEAGRISRILSPLAGGYLTYASLKRGKESAAGQMTIRELKEIYQYLQK